MTSAHNIQCQVWDANDNLVRIPYVTLLTWAKALRLELDSRERGSPLTMSRRSCASTVRRYLSLPPRFPLKELTLHIEESLADVKRQLGLSE